jgi:hypothetical protein
LGILDFFLNEIDKVKREREREGERNKWLHLFSAGIGAKSLIIIVNYARELFED